MERIVQLRLRESGQPGVYLLGELTVKTGDCVIVEADRGLDYGQAISEPLALDDPNAGTLAEESLRKVVRLVTAEDLKQIEENRLKAKESFDVCQKKIEENALSMKLVDAEYSFDQSKMNFYFTAEGREIGRAHV